MGLKRFDYKLKDNSKKKSIIVASIIVLVLIVGITIYSTYAAYKVTKTYNIIQGRVGEFVNADIKISVKTIDAEGNEATVSDFPSYLEYAYLADSSSCTNGSTIEFDEGKWSATISSSGKDTCTLKFEQRSTKTLGDAIKANSTLVETTPDFGVAATDENTNLYQAEDDLGTSYYFRGASTNNYVKFGTYAEDTTLRVFDYSSSNFENVSVSAGDPMYWRIVRINGDGSIRLIYDGVEKVTNGTTHTAIIGSTTFNDSNDNAKYVGYTFDDGNGVQVNSTIKGVVDDWYDKHLKTKYGNFISDSIFCNDRVSETDDSGTINYAAYDRLSNNKTPVLTCTNKNDRYTTKNTTNGNGVLNNPVGLITADEAFMAGGIIAENNKYYLYSGETYWTSSPSRFVYNEASAWTVVYVGAVSNYTITISSFGARPVINLDANIKMYGSGTMGDPYRLTKEL